jgi:formylglycine-generating enzyme required for sulfatase activity
MQDIVKQLFLAVFLAICSRAAAATISTVPIGNPGNPADMSFTVTRPGGVGSVAYEFRIGSVEVTNAQYAEFLNAVAASDPYRLYDTFMGSDTRGGIIRSGVSGSYTYVVKSPALSGTYTYDNKPVVDLSWGSAVRFANWLHNGQPIGVEDGSTTEDGAYTLNGAITNAALSVVTRNANALWWLPSEDEWYKAAHYDPVANAYREFPTGKNTFPDNHPPSTDTGNSANFGKTSSIEDRPFTTVGAYSKTKSPYGTFDQGGNAYEWDETSLSGLPGMRGGERRGLLGGSAYSFVLDLQRGSGGVWGSRDPAFGLFDIGFRLATVATIPEPSAIYLAVICVISTLWRRRRS